MTTSASQPHQDHIFKGILFACTAFFCFSLMQVFNKVLTGIHHPIDISLWRNLPAVLVCLAYALGTGQAHLLKTKMPGKMAARVIIGSLGLLLTFLATQHLPLSNATVLFFMSTLLVPVLAYFFLKEHIGWHRWGAIAIGLTGVIIAAGPTAQLTWIGAAFALGAAVTHGVIIIVLRAMREENAFTIYFYFFLGGVILPLFFLPWFGTWPTIETLPHLLATAITGGLGQVFLTRAMAMAPAAVINPFAYTGLIWAAVFDVFIWQSIPTWPVWLGGLIIMLSYFYILKREQKSLKQRRKRD